MASRSGSGSQAPCPPPSAQVVYDVELGRNLINYVIQLLKMVLSYPMDIQNPIDMDMDMNFYLWI
jgi:hypothetical protein